MKNLFLYFILMVATSFLQAQSIERQVIASGGAFAEATGLQLSFTVGELAIVQLENGELLLAQGFQQGEAATPVSFFEPERLHFTLYPNPTKDAVWLKMDAALQNSLKISIFNAEGKLLQQRMEALAAIPFELNLQPLPAGTYFILLENKDGQRGVASVLKH